MLVSISKRFKLLTYPSFSSTFTVKWSYFQELRD